MTLPKYAMNQSSFPELYERELVGPLFRPFAEFTIEQLQPGAEDSLLDIACGTGIVARLAKARMPRGRVVGVDLSADMLRVAGVLEPSVDWREGNAVALPIEAGETFNFVVCQQGLQFFPDKRSALAEMRRATKAGGRLAVSTWRRDEKIPFFFELRQIAERHLGPITDDRYSFGDADELARIVGDAGFHDVEVRTVSRTITFKDGGAFVRMNAMALVGMSGGGMSLGEEPRAQVIDSIVRESAETLSRFERGTETAFELVTNLATATG